MVTNPLLIIMRHCYDLVMEIRSLNRGYKNMVCSQRDSTDKPIHSFGDKNVPIPKTTAFVLLRIKCAFSFTLITYITDLNHSIHLVRAKKPLNLTETENSCISWHAEHQYRRHPAFADVFGL